MISVSYRIERMGRIERRPDYTSGWRSFGNTLLSQVVEGRYVLESDDGSLQIQRGMGFLVPTGLRHRVSSRGKGQTLVDFCHLHCRIHEAQDLFSACKRPLLFDKSKVMKLKGAFRRLEILENRSASLKNSVDQSVVLSELVGLAVEGYEEFDGLWEGGNRSRLLPVLKYIGEHLAEPIFREDLANVVGLSVPHLHTLFVKNFGVSPMVKVIEERMQQARQLLHWSDLSIAEVGERCGFPDPYYFSRAFKRAEGLPPKRYRKLVRE